MRNVAMGQDDSHGVLAPVSGIGTQVFGAALLGVGPLDHNALQNRFNLRHIMRVRSCHGDRQRDSTPVHQQVAFAAFFPQSVGFRPTGAAWMDAPRPPWYQLTDTPEAKY